MNEPDKSEYLPVKGELRVEFTNSTSSDNSATLIVTKEDHTLGNLLRMQLLKQPQVEFAGYRVPHPLEHKIVIKLKTNRITPKQAIEDTIKQLETDLEIVESNFEGALKNWRPRSIYYNH
eukprot:TRINITY_DN3304_c0_g2_i1.p1 TRINITY_DN3304_c0_g2~~TRINITY_DN3304_c0_g2_i1.p1  ORF type:complete len:120 (-),score=53.34 TRINITY_DN3304_c0_g2_i1:78-437(-)